jgi:hypothetical protein
VAQRDAGEVDAFGEVEVRTSWGRGHGRSRGRGIPRR